MGKLSTNLPEFTIERVLQSFSEVYDWGLRDLNVPDIHKKTLGEGVKVAVIDSGKSTHFETEDAIVAAKNFSKSPTLEDKNGHSTFCAGIIAARKNDQGIIGVAPKAKVYFAKAMDDSGAGEPSALVRAINWAAKQKVDIMSISAGMFFDFKPLKQAIQRAYKRNIIIVAAVGNTGTRHYDVAFPARYPEVIGVAAYDQKHKVARFSSRGTNVSFAMPGVNIYSTYLNNQFCKMNGTCLPKSEMIYTPKGPISISLLRKGDEVYSFNEISREIEPKRILNHWSYNEKQCLDIHTPHTKIRCTENHPILIKEDNKLVWKKANTVQSHDLIVTTSGLPRGSENIPIKIRNNWNASLLKPIKPNRGELKQFKAKQSTISGFLGCKYGLRYELSEEIIKYYNIASENIVFGLGKKHSKTALPQMDENLAYLCGFFLGDGWITKPVSKGREMGARIYFAVCNLDYVNYKLESTFKEVFLCELNKRKNQQYELCNTVIANIFEDLCGHKKAKDKEIPSWVYSLDKPILLSFLSGLIDSDGWITKSGYGFSSSSRKLTNGVIAMLDFLGNRRTNMSSRTRKIQAPNSKIPILSSEHAVMFRGGGDNGAKYNKNSSNIFESYSNIATISSIRTQKVMKIKQAGKHTVYDIEVEGNHNFIANNIIVHNSFACPIMAGICALILAKHREGPSSTPCETPQQMMEHLKKYAKKLNGKDETGFGNVDLKGIFADD